jgi:hypothetical protein
MYRWPVAKYLASRAFTGPPQLHTARVQTHKKAARMTNGAPEILAAKSGAATGCLPISWL